MHTIWLFGFLGPLAQSRKRKYWSWTM